MLPNKTPNWFLRLESDYNSIEISVVKNILRFWNKIITTPQHSLLRQCYEALKVKSKKPNIKHNWYKQLELLLSKWECETLLESIPEYYDENGCTDLLLKINNCIRLIKDISVEHDILRMQNSTSMPLYHFTKTHKRREPFLNAEIPWNVIRLVVQCRANLSQFTCCKSSVKLASMENFYDPMIELLCQNCNRREEENLFHVMCQCEKYSVSRARFLHKHKIPVTTKEYALFFTELDESKIMDIYLFFKSVIESRENTVT